MCYRLRLRAVPVARAPFHRASSRRNSASIRGRITAPRVSRKRALMRFSASADTGCVIVGQSRSIYPPPSVSMASTAPLRLSAGLTWSGARNGITGLCAMLRSTTSKTSLIFVPSMISGSFASSASIYFCSASKSPMVLLSVRSGPESNRRPTAYKAVTLPAELPEQVPRCPAGPGCRLSGCRSDLIPTGSIEPSNKLQHRE